MVTKKTRRGVFAVVVDKKGNMLVLHRVHYWRGWEVPKGGIDGKYSERECLENELWEELGLRKKDYEVIGRTNHFQEFKYPANYRKKWKVDGAKIRGWAIRAKKQRITFKNNPVREHDSYKWMPVEKALKRLSYANQRKAVKLVVEQFGL
ncbi:MAG: NUDIX hydrolase [Candidatus Micrarchaeota archaeon]